MTEEKLTFCRICEVYCGLVATVEDGRVTKLRPDREHVVSKGYSCPKGITFHEVIHDPDRVLQPLKKIDGAWVRIAWEQAIGEIVARLNHIRAVHGPHAIALYTGNPAGFSYSHRLFSNSWLDAIGSRNGYGAGSQDNLADFLASKFLYGAYALQPIPDVDRTRHLLVLGGNPAVSQGTIVHMADAPARLGAIRQRGGKVVVVDPRRSETARLADEHHFIRPDADVFLLLAMIHVILAEGLEARTFLARWVADADRLRAIVEGFTPELAAAETGITADTVRRLAREFAAADGACAYGRIVCGRFGTLAAWSLEVLNIVTGNLDRPGGAVFSDALIDLVGLSVLLGLDEYGGRRSRVGNHAAVLGELPSGILADEITTPGAGQIRALVVTAGNPVLSIANGPALARAMGQLELSVAMDFYLSETAVLCDYVLPCTTFLEREDFPLLHQQLMTEPYGQWTEAVVPPQGEAKQEWEIFALLSHAMGLPILNSRLAAYVGKTLRLLGRGLSPGWVLDAMIRLGPAGDRFLPWRDGFSLARLREHPHGVRVGGIHTGVLGEKLRTADRRIHLWNDALEAELRRLRASLDRNGHAVRYPFKLIGRRDARSHNSWLHNVPHLMRGDRCNRLRMHPDDAARLGLASGERALVRSAAGAVEVEVKVTDEVMPGVVSLPHGWGHDVETGRHIVSRDPGANCNVLIDQRVMEPLSGMAFLNGFPVAVERVAS
jgi:formate dehydrogenase